MTNICIKTIMEETITGPRTTHLILGNACSPGFFLLPTPSLTHALLLLGIFTALWRRNICHHCNFFTAFLLPCLPLPKRLMLPFGTFDFLGFSSPYTSVWKKCPCCFLSGTLQTTDFVSFSAAFSP